jgi:poly(3-hydroxybutyrate) depolymerase
MTGVEEPGVGHHPEVEDGEDEHPGDRGNTNGVEVVLVTVEGGSHTRPGRPGSAALGRSTRNVSADDLI